MVNLTHVRRTAVQAHQGQKYGITPYMTHVDAVVSLTSAIHSHNKLLRNHVERSKLIAIALLHDVVEDTTVTLTDIEAMYGAGVARNVANLTKIKGEFADRYFDRVISTIESTIVRLADATCNANQCLIDLDYTRYYKYSKLAAKLVDCLNKKWEIPMYETPEITKIGGKND